MKPELANNRYTKEMLHEVVIQQVKWLEVENNLRAVRTTVFIEEQHVTPAFEWDEFDDSAVHLLAIFDGQPIACLRIINFQKIGRMAVIRNWRGMRLGSALLNEAINICKNHGSRSIFISAQLHAINFYLKSGFKQISGEYTDVNITHVDMKIDL